jgi:glycosyltransferase involved in cell wall biosynthesis
VCIVRALFLNENLGGHTTLHMHLARALERDPRIDATFIDVPAPRTLRRLVGMSVPGLGHRDLDLQPLRSQLALSGVARQLVQRTREPFDVLHIYTQNAGLLLRSTMARVPSVVTVDTTNTLLAFRLPYRNPTKWTPRMLAASVPFERRVFNTAQIVVAQSANAAQSLRDDYAVPSSKLRIIRFGITDPEIPLATPAVGRPVITFVGTVMERKGGNALVRVFTEHLADRADLTLVTHESVTPRPGVRVINDIRPGDERLWRELRASAVFALPSEIDQSPNAVLEGMAAGLPVVAVRTGALAEVIEHGVTGLLIDPGDEKGLANALITLIDDPGLRARMGAAARAAFEARWSAATEARRLVDVLAEARDLAARTTA